MISFTSMFRVCYLLFTCCFSFGTLAQSKYEVVQILESYVQKYQDNENLNEYVQTTVNPAFEELGSIVCNENDTLLFTKFIDVLNKTSGSADETQADVLAAIYFCHPEMVEHNIDGHFNKIYLKSILTLGVRNQLPLLDDSLQFHFKKRIRMLNLGDDFKNSVSGNVKYTNGEGIPDVLIELICDSIILKQTRTDSLGNYYVYHHLEQDKDYYLKLDYGYLLDELKLIEKLENGFYGDHIFEFGLFKPRKPWLVETGIYFNQNQIDLKEDDFSDVVSSIKYVESIYSDFKLVFFQEIYPNESRRLAKKRMILFEKKLIEYQIDMSKIEFIRYPIILPLDIDDKRTRIIVELKLNDLEK